MAAQRSTTAGERAAELNTRRVEQDARRTANRARVAAARDVRLAAERAELAAQKAAEKAARDQRRAADRAARDARLAAERAELAAQKAAEKAARDQRRAADCAARDARLAAERAAKAAAAKLQKEIASGYKNARRPFTPDLLTGAVNKDLNSPNYGRHYIGKIGDVVCGSCSAQLWPGETSSLCCNKGKTHLPDLPAVPETLRKLLNGTCITVMCAAAEHDNNTSPLNG